MNVYFQNISSKTTIADDTVTLQVEKNIDITSLAPVIEVSPNANVNPQSGLAKDFTIPLKYTVTSESELKRVYYIRVIKDTLSSHNDIISCQLVNMAHSATIEGDQINIRVPKFTDLANLAPLFECSEFATISPQSGEKQDFNKPVEYTVTAEDGTQKNYIIRVVSAELSKEKLVLKFMIPNVKYQQSPIVEGLHFMFYKGVNLSNIAPIIHISQYATISPTSGQFVDLSKPVRYKITAEDGSDSTFTVSADNRLSSKAEILSFVLDNVTYKIETSGTNINIFTPNDVDVSSLKANIIVSEQAKVSPESGELINLSTPQTFTVTASDSTKRDYTVTVNKSPWRCLIENGEAPFLKVDGHRLVVHDGYMWLIGGWLGDYNVHSDSKGDYWTSQVWRTNDGVNWENMGDAPWKPRHGFGCVSYKGKIWVISGDDSRDIWSTVDGKIWTKERDNVPFNWRYFPYVAVFNDRIWLIGGSNGWWNNYEVYNDVWSSDDGIVWTLETQTAAFTARSMISGSIVLNDNIYIIGGGVGGPDELAGSYNDVWVSTNGSSYISATIEAPFRPLYWHSTGVLKNRMYVLAGMQKGNIHSNEVWFSTNGKDWTQQKYTFWLPRHATSAIEYNGKLYMVGGTSDPTPQANRNTMNDVWVMDGDFD